MCNQHISSLLALNMIEKKGHHMVRGDRTKSNFDALRNQNNCHYLSPAERID